MLKQKLIFAVVALAPIAALAGDGGSDSSGSFVLEAVTRLAGKLLGWF